MNLPINYNDSQWFVRREACKEYKKLQNNKCWHCGDDLNNKPAKEILDKPINKNLFPPNFFMWPIHLHHNRETGDTIGAVHNYCNAVLWQYNRE